MRLNEVNYADAKPIDGYGPDFFRIGGVVSKGATLVFAGGTRSWGGYEDRQPLLDLAEDVDVIFIGTGAEITHLPVAFRETFEAAGIGVEPMGTPAACRTYNVLLSEGRRVAAALLPV